VYWAEEGERLTVGESLSSNFAGQAANRNGSLTGFSPRVHHLLTSGGIITGGLDDARDQRGGPVLVNEWWIDRRRMDVAAGETVLSTRLLSQRFVRRGSSGIAKTDRLAPEAKVPG
jgi:hypothetical protein